MFGEGPTLEAAKAPDDALGLPAILRFHAQDGRVWDTCNGTVVVTQTLLRDAADEIERLRAALSALVKEIDGTFPFAALPAAKAALGGQA